MANPDHLALLNPDVEAWNEWRQAHPGIEPDLSGANLSGANLSRTNFLRTALHGADLSEANLSGTDFSGTDLRRVNLGGAVDLRGAVLSGA